jgi:16S rRNA (adenine1518-N6/adenine1519-N6)-dimethyltransferase
VTDGPAFPDARALLDKHGLRAKKHFGQNFLIADRVFRAIVDAAVAKDDDWVVEIGAGLGTLTARLCERAHEGKVIALERDPDMIAVLRAELGHLIEAETLVIEAGDAMKYDLAMAARWHGGDPIAVCGNLPYHVAAPLIFKALDARQDVSRIVVMVQREMADRIVAAPDTDAYGAMTVMIQMFADVSMVAKVGAGAFVPPPKVDSAVVKIVPRPAPRAEIGDEKHFSRVVHAAFGQRRKTLRNALRAVFDVAHVDAALATTTIDGQRRGETLTLAEFAALTREIPRA